MKIKHWLQDKLFFLKTGTPIRTLNDGKPIDEVVIRYKDFYFMIDFDVANGEPTGDFGWSREPMTPTPIRDFWTAQKTEPITEGTGGEVNPNFVTYDKTLFKELYKIWKDYESRGLSRQHETFLQYLERKAKSQTSA